MRGQWFERDGVKILPTFRPATVLRDRGKLSPVAEDFRWLAAARRALEKNRKQRAEQLPPDFVSGGREIL